MVGMLFGIEAGELFDPIEGGQTTVARLDCGVLLHFRFWKVQLGLLRLSKDQW